MVQKSQGAVNMKKYSENVLGADAKSVTCEVDDNTLLPTMIFDFGDYQVRMDDKAITLASKAAEDASVLLMNRYDASALDSPLRRLVDLRRDEMIMDMAESVVEKVTLTMIDRLASCPNCKKASLSN